MIIYEVKKINNTKEIKQIIDYYVEFISWYYKKIEEGYDAYINLDEINNLITKIGLWYEFKYPDKYFETYDFEDDLPEYMDINRLKDSLLTKEVSILDSQYRLNNKIGRSKLYEIVFNHETDLELKNWLFSLVNLFLIYSRNTIPEYGEKRANLFSEEFSRYYQITVNCPIQSNNKTKIKTHDS